MMMRISRRLRVQLLAVLTALAAIQSESNGQINTDVETAQTQARETGRPILAIAGSKT